MADRLDYADQYKGWIEAFQIFQKYEPDTHHIVQPAHDIVYSGCDPELVSDEDKQKLEALGWFVSEFGDGYAKFT